MGKVRNYVRYDAVEHPDFKGYYYYKDTRFVINRDGRCIDTVRMCSILPRVKPDKYYQLYDPDMKISHVFHRAVASLFVRCPGNEDVLLVNHLDGVKCHNWASNLEWTTYAGNSIHAYATGLRADNKNILVKDLTTDVVIDYYSLNRAAVGLDVNPGTLHVYLNNTKSAPFKDKYVAIYKGEKWPLLTIDDVGKHRNGRAKELILIYPDKTKVICGSVGIAAKILNVAAHNIYGYLNKNSKTFILPDHDVMYLSDYKECILDAKRDQSTSLQGTYRPVRKPTRIRVTDVTDGSVEEWESTEKFATFHGTSKNTVQKRINVTGGRWKTFKIEYLK